MLRKISLVLSAVAALGLAVAFSAPADAEPVNKNVRVNRTVNVHRNVTVNRNVRVNRSVGVRGRFVVGQRYNGHVWYGHNRHRWHGVWYGYGIGPCWINVDGEWFWNDVACP
ncbi:MAG TPA: hypothetical protein VFC45_05745 [Pseudolabrys sp.]|nr:hypothetical protein [Pseudolabrys sp.]